MQGETYPMSKCSRRSFLCSMAGSAVGAALGGAALTHAAVQRRPNIVLCMADDQGWGDMAYNGHPILKTPNFDEAAAAGIRFDRFYAAAPVCSPTRGSVMTGRHPNRFGCFSWGYTLRPDEITLPEALKQAGYVTGHFGKWHLGSVEKHSPVNPGASGFDEWFSAWNFFDVDPILSREGAAVQCDGDSSDVTVDAAIDFMQKHAASDRPFLAVVWFGSPHNPHRALDEDKAPYASQDEEYAHFLGEIAAMDRAFGRLRGSLGDLGIRENTILWYCSDNGGLRELGTSGGRAHKGQLYEGGLRVPAFIEWPEQLTDPRVTNLPCNTVDIYPTLLDIAGVHIDRQPVLDGMSLVPLFTGAMPVRPRPMGFWAHPAKGRTTPSHELMADLLAAQEKGKEVAHTEMSAPFTGTLDRTNPAAFPGHAAWLAWPWKLHKIPADGKSGVFQWELYNLDDDPGESNNISEVHPERVDAMRAALETWQASVAKSLEGEDYT